MEEEEISEEEYKSEDESSGESIDGGDAVDSDEESEGEYAEETPAVFEFMTRMRYLLDSKYARTRLRLSDDEERVEQYIVLTSDVIKNFDRLDKFNTKLLALAACFDIIYTTKDKVNEKNITEFIKEFGATGDTKHEPIDVIRYIRMYQDKK